MSCWRTSPRSGWEHVNLTGDYIWGGQHSMSENTGGLRGSPNTPGRHLPQLRNVLAMSALAYFRTGVSLVQAPLRHAERIQSPGQIGRGQTRTVCSPSTGGLSERNLFPRHHASVGRVARVLGFEVPGHLANPAQTHHMLAKTAQWFETHRWLETTRSAMPTTTPTCSARPGGLPRSARHRPRRAWQPQARHRPGPAVQRTAGCPG